MKEEFKIYIVLGGEDNVKRQRTNKLIKEIYKNKNLDFENIKIILSGRAWFRYETNETEAHQMQQYILEKTAIPKSSIILEEESMDTLGNLYFSSKIILELVAKLKEDKYNRISINIITEGFHMHRAKHFFNFIFQNWIFRFKTKYNFLSADSKFKSTLQKLMKPTIDRAVEYAIDLDFKTIPIKNFQDYEDFLFSMPVYRQKYTPKRRITSYSLYATMIEKEVLEHRKGKTAYTEMVEEHLRKQVREIEKNE